MNSLGSRNLLTSSYVNGTDLPQSTFIEGIEAIHNWIKHKDSDWAMSKYRMAKTNRITILHHIPLDILQSLLNDLLRVYKTNYPYSERKDFLEGILAFTIYDLKRIIGFPDLKMIWYGSPLDNPSNVYHYYDMNDNEYCDYILETDYDIDFYRQYYKKVLSIIENLDLDGINSSASKPAMDIDLTIQEKQTSESENSLNKPQINAARLEELLLILQDFFDPEQHDQLAKTLAKFTIPRQKLIFKSSGNKLSDVFKKIKEANIITGWQKKQLEDFIVHSFHYIHNGNVQEFKLSTVQKTISRNETPCKNPIIEIVNGSIQRINH